MIASLVLQGYNESIKLIQRTQAANAARLYTEVNVRSKAAFVDLVQESPVDTRAMQGGFRLVRHGPLTVEVLNEVNRDGFSYPSAQATGTGALGIPVIGMTTTFNSGWAGMVPNPQFRAAWVRAAADPLAVEASLF